jgi:hypothetical protein
MRVYYFTKSEHGLENIKLSRLKISTFNNLNDPFELLGVELSDRSVRKAMQFEKDQFSSSHGLICFSEDWQDPVQWAHYAENHKGICLGFDIDNRLLKKVSYVKYRLKYALIKSSDKINKLLTTKFYHWNYEKEHRIIIPIKNLTSENGLYFESFSNKVKLKEVIIGCQSKLTQSDVLKEFKMKPDSVRIINTRSAFRQFKIVWDRSKKSTK